MDNNMCLEHQAFILKLPDEILDAIISLTAPVLRSHRCLPEHSKVYEMAIALSLVCKRFHRITVPYMYMDLGINTNDDAWRQPKKVFKNLHRSFRENPSLWKLCRNLTVIWSKSNDRNLYIAADCLTWLTAAKTLTFWDLNGKKAWELLRLATEQKSACDTLSLSSNYNYDLHLPFVIDVLGDFTSGFLPNLKKLNLDGVSFYGDQMSQAALREKAGMAPFTKLQLCSFLLTPKSLEGLVRWSSRLEEFELKYTFGDDYATDGFYSDWRLAKLQPILSVHRKTLRSITLYGIGSPGFDGFDLRQFDNLEELSLSSQISGHQGPRERTIYQPPDGLFASRLRVFHWDLTLLDQQLGESLSDFDQEEEDWLRLFARKAIECRCPLQRIKIKFTPCDWQGAGDVYPWDRMDAMGADLRPHGIKVSYNPPSISREQYMTYIANSAQKDPALAAEMECVGNTMLAGTVVPTI
ncbi:uncharacterized protein N7479_010372 [Penicillium vulpinum]|uniref:F-box domain-containing protein n=1 Tax=Penicillium vulpinum TaxID=29845 RepID=A0A1V6S8Z1_9EURO|nr:uncharacterized protein N7479_010372 [Penicillium vulpinum]KAJ5951959.1 hypothetical protein N7479_010372 [Penicillium vulpinum]OQE10328.1 hypothetical protein PENVUL_c004G08354 [Penicillium vulpinum]